MTLDQLTVQQEAVVVGVRGEGAFRRRLLELGLTPGTPIRRTGAAPLGEPLTFQARGAALALRRAEARAVEVEVG